MDAAGGGGGAASAAPSQNAGAPWRRQGSQGGGGGNASSPSSPAPQASTNPSPPSNSGMGPPPPPPPMAPGNAIPSVRLNSEIGPRDSRGPPMAIASAMMKDKKPFTYTPGGIDLSEIRSPRMAKRIQVNAAAEGVSSVPMSQQQQGLPQQGGPPPPPTYLPPAAMAAMNPAMAIPVLPQGGFNPGNLHRTQKPSDFVRQESDFQSQYQPPHQSQQHPHQPHFLSQQLQQQIQQHQQQRQPPQYHHPQQHSPSNVQTPLAPPPPPPMSSSPTGVPIQLMNNVSGRTSTSPERSSGTGSIYIPPLNTTTTPSSGGGGYSHVASSPSSHQQQYQQQQQARPTQQTKAQAHSQNLGSIYIPPIEQRPSVFSERNTSSPSTASTSIESPTKTPQTPQLNKINPPWMNSYNRIQSQPQGVPQSPNANATPWGTITRTIPITIVREDDDNNQANMSLQQSQQPQYAAPPPWRQQQQHQQPQQQQHHHQQQQQQPVADHGYSGARVVPIQIEAQSGGGGFREIPIQIEGNVKRGPTNQPGTPTPGGRPSPYNYNYPTANQAKDAFARQASELSAGVDKISMSGDESPRMEPIQSKSFRVIQKITDDVDEGSSLHKSSEPRYTGVHIPSRAFRCLQSNLPPGPGAGVQDFTPNCPTQTGPVTHNIPITMVPLSPQSSSQQPPNFGVSRQQQGQQQNRAVPPSQQQVAEPKKYMGSSIPSRSFKILQQMTADDDAALGAQSADDDRAETSPNKKVTSRPPRPPCRSLSSTPTPLNQPNNNNQFVRSRTMSPTPRPATSGQCTCNCNHGSSNNYNNSSSSSINNGYNYNNNYYNQQYGGSESESEDFVNIGGPPPPPPMGQAQQPARSYSPWPENYDPNYDPYAYMQWYYWWYYNYGYPMAQWNGSYDNPQQQPPQQQNYSLNPHQTQGGGGSGVNNNSYAYTDSEAEQSDSSSYQYLSTEEEESLMNRNNFKRQSSPKQHYLNPYDNSNYYYSEGENDLNSSTSVPKIVIDKSRESLQGSSMSVSSLQEDLMRATDYGSNSEVEEESQQMMEQKKRTQDKFVMNESRGEKYDNYAELNEKYWNRKEEEETIPESVENFVNNKNDHVVSACDSRRRVFVEKKVEEDEKIERKSVPENEESELFESDLLDDNVERVNDVCSVSDCADVNGLKNDDDHVINYNLNQETAPLPNPIIISAKLNGSSNDNSDRDRFETFIDCNGETEDEEISLKERKEEDEDVLQHSTTTDYSVCSNVGVVEEPDTPSSSSEEDAPTLVDESEAMFNHTGVVIEEYYSTTESESNANTDVEDSPDAENFNSNPIIFPTSPPAMPPGPNFAMQRPKKLSTIDEMSERSQRTMLSSYDEDFRDFGEDNTTIGEDLISDDEEDTTDEGSSVSVIENKSDANNDWGATTAGESHADEASTSSESEDDNDDDPLLPTVTVQLPLTLSFSKSRSFRDIATFRVGDSQVTTEESQLESQLEFNKNNDEDEDGDEEEEEEEDATEATEMERDFGSSAAISWKDDEEDSYNFMTLSKNNSSRMSCDSGGGPQGIVDEVVSEPEFCIVENSVNDYEHDDDEPVVSYTISLSRSTSKSCGKKHEDDSESGEELEVDPAVVASIQQQEETSKEEEDVDFWGAIQQSDEESKSPFWKEFKHRSADEIVHGWNNNDDNDGQKRKDAPSSSVRPNEDMDPIEEDFWAELDTKVKASSQHNDDDGHQQVSQDNEKECWLDYADNQYSANNNSSKEAEISDIWNQTDNDVQEEQQQLEQEEEEEEEADFWREIKSTSNSNDEDEWSSKEKEDEVGAVNFWDRGRTFFDPKKFNRQFSWEIQCDDGDDDQVADNGQVNNNDESKSSDKAEEIVEHEPSSTSEFEDEHICPEKQSEAEAEGEDLGKRRLSEALLNFAKFEEATRHDRVSEELGQVKIRSKSTKVKFENNSSSRDGVNENNLNIDTEDSLAEKVNRREDGFKSESVRKSEEKLNFKEIKSELMEQVEIYNQTKETSVTSTSKIDTIFSNRKLDNCDFVQSSSNNSQQQMNGNGGKKQQQQQKIHNKFGGCASQKSNSNHRMSRMDLDGTASADENSDAAVSDESSSTTVAENKKSSLPEVTGTDSLTRGGGNDEGGGSEKVDQNRRDRKSSSPQYELKRTTSLTKKEVNERNVEIKETRERFKLRPDQNGSLDLTTTDEHNGVEMMPSPQSGERINRAEDLLWRIERFLQCSLSLGSEDDSGVMTDISRQISDVDTDENENVEAETVVFRNKSNNSIIANNNPIPVSNNKSAPSSRSMKTRSMIETYSSSSKVESFESEAATATTTTTTSSSTTTNNNGVVMRNMSAEKKSLRYQRAKTHSRLFQLLQSEASKDESSEEEMMEGEAIDYENLEQVEAAIEKSQNKKVSVTSLKDTVTSSTEMNHGGESSGRLVPLPIKNFLASSMSMDSTSSSSGVLSPSSPVSRDQLLADIINEFHQRHQTKTKKRVSNFPSKIFKLLQSEFGEEFYDAFDCCEDDFVWDNNVNTSTTPKQLEPIPDDNSSSGGSGSGCSKSHHKNKSKQNCYQDCYDETPSSTSPSSSSGGGGGGSSSKNYSKKQEQEILKMMVNGGGSETTTTMMTSVDSSSSNKKIEFLEVPPRRKKSSLNRDPRVPKNRNKSYAAEEGTGTSDM